MSIMLLRSISRRIVGCKGRVRWEWWEGETGVIVIRGCDE